MARLARWWTCTALVFAVFGSNAAAATGDGLPVGNVDSGPTGVTAPGETARYVTLPAGENTVVARVERGEGRVLRSRFLHGDFTVPAVALDGTAAGLSADGTTLALIRPRARFPQRRTSLLILDAELLQLRHRATLRGDFSFDAISPDGRSLYLVEYLSRRDPTRYAVRAYDVDAGRLLAAPIVDPREPEEQMGGYPITRVSSADGRWAYTLYDGAGKHPFIHALDTTGRTAACIDLDALTGRKDLWELRMAVDAARQSLNVVDGGGGTLAVVNTRTFRVTAPATTSSDEGDSSEALTYVVVALATLLVAGALAAGQRRRRRLATGH
jgi:MYXO-CTERM domain-containing protein